MRLRRPFSSEEPSRFPRRTNLQEDPAVLLDGAFSAQRRIAPFDCGFGRLTTCSDPTDPTFAAILVPYEGDSQNQDGFFRCWIGGMYD